MRDIGARIQRYRLSRYAPPEDRARLRWIWLVIALWLVWLGFASEHNFMRLWRLSQERQRLEAELRQLKQEVTSLDARLHDPAAQRELAERVLREKAGMAQPGEIIYRIRPAGSAGR